MECWFLHSVFYPSILLSLLLVYSSVLAAVGSLGSKDAKLLSAHSDVFISPFRVLDFMVIPNADEVGLLAKKRAVFFSLVVR